MYNLDVTVDGVEKETLPTLTYRHSLQDKDGWYVGSLRLPDVLPMGAKLAIVVMVDADIDYMGEEYEYIQKENEAERNARDGYCGEGDYNV